jgi:hypothetical protein
VLEQKVITEWKFIPKKQVKYDKNMCCYCKDYCYLSLVRCLDCQKAYCLDHVYGCCCDQYQLLLREPNEDRQRLLELLAKLPRAIEEAPIPKESTV